MNHLSGKSRKLYCGIDLHSRKSYLHVLDEEGNRIKSGEIDTTGQSFRVFFEELIDGENDVSAAIEIGSLTFRYCNVLREIGISVHVVNTLKNAYIAKSMKKTDKEDARRLAIQLWKNILPEPVHVPDHSEHLLRTMVSHRASLVKSHTRLINRAHHRLRNHEIQLQKRSLKNVSKWEDVLEGISSTEQPLLHLEVSQMMEQFRTLQNQIRETENQMLHLIHQDPEFNIMYSLLQTIPGMGIVTAAAVLALIGHHVERFKNVRKLASYFGQCPKVRESGGKTLGNSGITKQGNSRIRGYFTQVALAVLRTEKANAIPLHIWYENIRRRKGWKAARVALSRKMAAIAYGVLKHRQPYDPSRVTWKEESA
ncbi:MAG: IS110 family transposase [Lentisphaerae bacterium]|nr:MAG: IS110 family transposase [Lentisphaerota bacterium]